tara:strand:+ start:331 stop:438 length:108 start_codon:yes stop_codon:yes gene_type:complete
MQSWTDLTILYGQFSEDFELVRALLFSHSIRLRIA